jgi:hypothetical protein
VAPIGAPRDDLQRAIGAIRADAAVSDTSHAVAEAIRLVAQTPADRHIIVVATDGKPDDKVLGSEDLIRAARAASVVVVGIGYRERTGDGPELGSLKRLAEETGGFYAEPLLPATRVEDAIVARFAQFAASGGLATFPLDKANPRAKVELTVETEGGRPFVGSYVPDITLQGLRKADVKPQVPQGADAQRQAPGPKPAANAPPMPIPPATLPAAPQPDPVEPGTVRAMLLDAADYGWAIFAARPLTIIGVTMLVVLIAVGSFGFAVRRARRIKIFAWIELLDPRRTRFPVTTPGVRLGRHSDNDIRFRDKSVHRYHAVLQRDSTTGRYQITDVSRNQARSNGVMVNGEFVHQPVVLENGDTIELGDISFRFVYT